MNQPEDASLADRFELFLRRNGLKFTSERNAILREVIAAEGLFEAEDLLVILKGKGIKTSRATVYRVLELLCRAAILRKVCLGEAHIHFQKISEQPRLERMICLKCGDIREFQVAGLDQIHRDICRQNDFTLTDYCFQLFGFCRKCAGD